MKTNNTKRGRPPRQTDAEKEAEKHRIVIRYLMYEFKRIKEALRKAGLL